MEAAVDLPDVAVVTLALLVLLPEDVTCVVVLARIASRMSLAFLTPVLLLRAGMLAVRTAKDCSG